MYHYSCLFVSNFVRKLLLERKRVCTMGDDARPAERTPLLQILAQIKSARTMVHKIKNGAQIPPDLIVGRIRSVT